MPTARAIAAAVVTASGLTSAALGASPVTRFAGREAPMHEAPVVAGVLKLDAARGSYGGAAAVGVDAAAYAALRNAELAVVPGVTLDVARGIKADLELERFEVFTPDAKLVVVTPGGEIETARPDMQLWRGAVTGDADSRVFLAITPERVDGYIVKGGETFVVSSGPAGAPGAFITGARSAAGAALQFAPTVCDGAILPPGVQAPAPNTRAANSGERANWTCKQFRVAVDTDNEFQARLGTVTAAQNYATLIIAAESEIYQRDVNIALKLSYLRIWTTPDPWTAADNPSQLNEFLNYWNANMSGVQREVAHLMSPRNLGGGIAYLQAICTGAGYGVSANLNGFFPYPLVDHNGSNWDINVVSHEMGHNFGTGHTHESNWYNPIIDGCGLAYVGGVQDCSQAFSAGSIMSYCHICPGGMSNIALTFGPRVETVIRNWVDGGASFCGSALPSVASNPSAASVDEGDPVTLIASFNTFGTVAYQWRRNGQNLTNGGRFSGVNTASLTITPTQTGDTGNYDLVVTGTCGQGVTQSAPVSVNPTCPQGQDRPTITQNPSGASRVEGQSVSFNVAATGAGQLTFRWRKGVTDLNDGGAISGATTQTLTINPVVVGDTGLYNCVVQGPQCRTTSASATLTVTPPPPGGFTLLSPAPGAVQVPTNSSFDWDDAAGAVYYRFVLDNNGDFSSPLIDISNLTQSTANVSPGTLQGSTTYYWKVEATNDFGVTQSSPVSASFTTYVPPPACTADFDGNHAVNTTDLALMLGVFGHTVQPFSLGDLNGDGVVSTPDLISLLAQFGRTDCP